MDGRTKGNYCCPDRPPTLGYTCGHSLGAVAPHARRDHRMQLARAVLAPHARLTRLPPFVAAHARRASRW